MDAHTPEQLRSRTALGYEPEPVISLAMRFEDALYPVYSIGDGRVPPGVLRSHVFDFALDESRAAFKFDAAARLVVSVEQFPEGKKIHTTLFSTDFKKNFAPRTRGLAGYVADISRALGLLWPPGMRPLFMPWPSIQKLDDLGRLHCWFDWPERKPPCAVDQNLFPPIKDV